MWACRRRGEHCVLAHLVTCFWKSSLNCSLIAATGAGISIFTCCIYLSLTYDATYDTGEGCCVSVGKASWPLLC